MSPPRRARRPLGKRLKDRWSEHSILFSYTRYWTRRLKYRLRAGTGESIEDALGRPESMWTLDDESYRSWRARGLETATRHMDELRALAREWNFELMIAVYPWPDQIWHRDLDSRQVRHWRDWAARNGVGFLDLFPLFINDREPEEVIRRYFIPGDIHWNERGHRLIADRLIERLAAPVSQASRR